MRDVDHLLRDDPGAGIFVLGEGAPPMPRTGCGTFGKARAACDPGHIAVVFGPDHAAVVGFDAAALLDPSVANAR